MNNTSGGCSKNKNKMEEAHFSQIPLFSKASFFYKDPYR